MKLILGSPILLAVSLCTMATSTSRNSVGLTGDEKQVRVPVLVELFTSEGCSSCPPADSLLLKLDSQQSIQQAEVIALEEHVDYWNHDGWIDPYSAPEWTQRQQDYVSSFKLDGVYTPQIIINGQSQVIGSRFEEVITAIKEAAGRPALEISIRKEQADARGSLRVTANVGALGGWSSSDSAEVWLAVSESDLSSSVSRGENKGKELHHAPALRMLRRMGTTDSSKQALAFSGSIAVSPKPSWKTDHLRLVVFVQEKKSRHVLGAASTSWTRLPGSGPT